MPRFNAGILTNSLYVLFMVIWLFCVNLFVLEIPRVFKYADLSTALGQGKQKEIIVFFFK